MTKLSKFAQDGEGVSVEGPKKVEPRKVTFRGRILAIDQSIANTGWACLKVDDESITVVATGNIQSEPTMGLKAGSFQDTFLRVGNIFVEMMGVAGQVKPTLIVHEMPAIVGRVQSRNKEQNVAVCSAVHCVGQSVRVPVAMQNSQHVKKQLTDDGKADKKQVAEAVRARLPTLASRKDLRFNEHTYDAIAVGIVAAEEN